MTFDEAIIKWNAALEKGPLTNPLLSSPFAGVSDKKISSATIYQSNIFSDYRRVA
ncbi:hypothetical protein WDV13_08750 [Weissella cibaria]